MSHFNRKMRWSRYNRALAERGGLTIYLGDDLAAKWSDTFAPPVLAGFALPAPDPSTLCRRRRSLVLPYWPKAGSCLVIDSTGLQIRGPNTWLTTVHEHRRRTYRKIHLGFDPDSSLIVAGLVTPCQTHDSTALEPTLAAADFAAATRDGNRWRGLRPPLLLHCGQKARSPAHNSSKLSCHLAP